MTFFHLRLYIPVKRLNAFHLFHIQATGTLHTQITIGPMKKRPLTTSTTFSFPTLMKFDVSSLFVSIILPLSFLTGFKGQCTSTVLQLLSDNHIQIAIVPANLTDRLQSLDISVNKAVKEHLRKEFSRWYSEQLCSKIKSNPPAESPHSGNLSLMSATVDLSLSTLKPLGVKWLVSMYDYFKANKEIIVNGFTKAGINSRK